MRALLLASFCFTTAHAIVPPEYQDPLEPWQSSIEFGWNLDKSNKTTQALNSVLIVDYDADEAFNGHLEYSFDYASDDGEAFIQKSRLQLQGDYAFSKQDYAFVRTDLKRHKFASYAKEFTYTTGYGRTFIDKKRQKLSFEIGPGFRYAKPQENATDTVRKEEAIVRSVLKFQHFFTDRLKFYIDASVETGNKNTVTLFDSKLENKIVNDLSLVFNFSHSYTKHVPDGAVKEELSNKINIRYLF